MPPPSAPTITSAVNNSGTVTISWSAVSGATSYTVSLSPAGGTTAQTTSETTVTYSNVTSGQQYTVTLYATNASGNSANATQVVDDISYGLIWWLDVNDTNTLTFSGTRTVGSTSYPVVTGIADKSGSGGASKNAVVTTGTNPTATGPIYFSTISDSIVSNTDLRTYAPGNSSSNYSTVGINKPGLLFRGRSNPAAPNNGYDSLQGTPGSSSASGTPMSFFSVCKQLGNASFFGSTDNNGTYINYDQWYGEFANGGFDAINNVNRVTASKINQYNFVVEGVYQTPAGSLAVNINGTTTSTKTSPSHIGNFNNMRICGRTSMYTPSGYFNELMLYNRVLSANEVKMVEGYLGWKWNIGLSASHPYTSTPYDGTITTSGGSSSAAGSVRGAPTLTGSPTVTLTSIEEDTASPSGDTVASLITSLGADYTPYDAADTKGIAIYSALATNGTWQYSTNSGSSWTAMSGLSATTHLLLTGAGTTNMVRFVPSANYNGTASISFRAWDTTSGTAGTTTTVSSTGGYTKYSSGTATGSITITGVNDAPIVSGSYSFATVESSGSAMTPVSVESILSSFTLSDADINNAQSVTAMAIIAADTTVGTWYYTTDNQVTWNALTSVTASTAVHLQRTANEYVKFVPATSSTYGTTSLQIRAWDKTNEGSLTNGIGNASSGGGSTAYSVTTPTLTCSVVCVPSAPTTLQASLTGAAVRLQWLAPSSSGGTSITAYKIYRVVSGSDVFEQTVTGLETTVASSLTIGSTYTFKVSALNSVGESVPTSDVSIEYAAAPTAPTDVTVVSKNAAIDISWTASASTGSQSITSYELYNADMDTLLTTVSGTTTSTTLSGLNNLLAYGVVVVAVNDANLTAASSAAWSLPFATATSSVTSIRSTLGTTLEGRSNPVGITASIVKSVAASGNAEKDQIMKNVMDGTFKKLVSETAISQEVSSTVTTLGDIVTGLSDATTKVSLVKSTVELVLEDAVAQNTVAATKVSAISSVFASAVSQVTSASSLTGLTTNIVKDAATSLLTNSSLQTVDAVATLLTTANSNASYKSDIVETLITSKGGETITVTSDALTTLKISVDAAKRGTTFNALTTLSVKVPSGSNTVDVSTVSSGASVYVPMKPEVSYTVSDGSNTVTLNYNASQGKLYKGGVELALNSTITIGTKIFTVLQVGSTTLQYTSNTGGGGGSGGGGGGRPPCIVKGQQILTPEGYVPVETLKDGDAIVTSENRIVPVKVYHFTISKTDEKSAPYTIAAGAFGKNMPPRDIRVSGLHAIKKDKHTWELPMAAANRYKGVMQDEVGGSVTYYHVETPNYLKDHLVVEGATVESFGMYFMKRNGLKDIQMYTWSSKYNGYTRYTPTLAKSAMK